MKSLLNLADRRSELATACIFAALLLAIVRWSDAAEGIVPRDRHPWGAFLPGSWKLVGVTTESFDEAGKSAGKSSTETKTVLVAISASSYELQIEATVDVAGKRFAAPAKISRQGFHGEIPGQRFSVRRLATTPLQIADRTIDAQVAEVEIEDKDSRRVTRVHYSQGMVPFVLARHSTTFDAVGKVQQQIDVETKALQVPRVVLGFRRSTWSATTTQVYPGGKIVTDETHCAGVPGGVVEHTSQESDEKGTLLRRSKLELINFGVATAPVPVKQQRSSRKRHHQKRLQK